MARRLPRISRLSSFAQSFPSPLACSSARARVDCGCPLGQSLGQIPVTDADVACPHAGSQIEETCGLRPRPAPRARFPTDFASRRSRVRISYAPSRAMPVHRISASGACGRAPGASHSTTLSSAAAGVETLVGSNRASRSQGARSARQSWRRSCPSDGRARSQRPRRERFGREGVTQRVRALGSAELLGQSDDDALRAT